MSLSFDAVDFSYGTTEMLSKLSVEFRGSMIHALVGRSGSGKTTILKLALGLLRPFSGCINVPTPTASCDHAVGYVAQDYGLLDWYTVRQNIGLGSSMSGRDPVLMSEIELIAGQLGIGEVLDTFPKHLSGGMRQRTSVARALIGKPTLLCMDEPFSALDVLSRQQSKALLRDIHLSNSITTLFVSHDLHDAIEVSDMIHVVTRESDGVRIATLETAAIDKKNSIEQICDLL